MTTASDLSDAIQAAIQGAVAATFTPADQIRVLLTLSTAGGTGPAAILCRRLSVIALAQAAAAYEPTSYDDAQTILGQVEAALETEITAAGDAEDDDAFQALQALRAATVADMLARGASLAPLVTVRLGAVLPALVVAQKLYGDATRADEVVQRVDPIHPLFMPPTMQVLGS